jgi:phospho-N-acetylmuramoyl-pentapeptide-transferase
MMTVQNPSLVSSSVLGFVLTVILLPVYIAWLKRKQVEQFIREEGPQSHKAKAKTPTTGGVVFILTTLISSVICLGYSQLLDLSAMLVLVVGLLCGVLGFIDDFAKIQNKANKGLSGYIRLAIEIGLGLGFGYLLITPDGITAPVMSGASSFVNQNVLALALPFELYMLMMAFYIAATTNAVNLHDGMDGLCAGTSLQVFVTLGIMYIFMGNTPLAVISLALAGTLLGFLLFNKNPASIFMGDTGSLFIGGTMASLVLAGGLELWFIPLALIYIVETLSVIAQVLYFKLTKNYKPPKPMSGLQILITKLTKKVPGEGKRLFRMAPLHHHFEAVAGDHGIKEWQVVAGFWVVQFIICTLVLVAFVNS